MLTTQQVEELQAAYPAWVGSQDSISVRLLQLAYSHIEDYVIQDIDWNQLSMECSEILNIAILEQATYLQTNGAEANTRQGVLSIKAGDAAESYSNPVGVSNTLADNVITLLNGDCGFMDRRTIGVRDACDYDCGCDDGNV